jgi:IclR family acetate operon transcriptional repressor
MLLADMAPEHVERIARERRPAAVVPAAPPSADELLRSVLESRQRGYGTAFGETIAGVNTVAAPVRGADGRTMATISVTGPASRMDRDRLEQLVPDLVACVTVVSSLHGYVSGSAATRNPTFAELDSGALEVRAATR